MQIVDKLEQVQNLDLRGGTRLVKGGIEFALFSEHATRVELCLFDEAGAIETNRYSLHQHQDHIWRGFLPKSGASLKYGYRMHGPYKPEQGHWFNPNKLLVDPFAREIFGEVVNHSALFTYAQSEDSDTSFDTTDNAAYVPKSVVIEESEHDDDLDHLQTPLCDTVIYELHVTGYSKQHNGLPEVLRGTFEGLTSAPLLEHMVNLGITAVELLPVYPFNDEPHLWSHGLSNYWGYNPYNFFATDTRFGNPRQFRSMVRKFHQAGIEVLLDVVYNHTGEGEERGPTLSLRGIDNASYYRHLPDQPGTYVNDTGCGNTLDFDHPYVREMVLASLRYWATEMGVDGFRFDLAPIMARSMEGFSKEAPFFKSVQADPVLSRLKLIAEPWDIGPGGYQLGEFPLGWSEWNDKYRDTVRAFWRGDDSIMGELAGRLSGSKELFLSKGRNPQAGINFITAHDGFTLQDLVSYEDKHNEANLEENRDGSSHNISRNYGVEGPSTDPEILELRNRHKRNMLATLFLSQGVPMLQAGDELGRTQNGNNNSYCQDNEISWLDWQTVDDDLSKFVSDLIKLRRRFPQLRLHGFLTGEPGLKGDVNDVTWLSPLGKPMQNSDWELPYARCFGFHLAGLKGECPEEEQPLLVLFNAHHEAIDFKMPSSSYGQNWSCLLETDGAPDQRAELAPGQPLLLTAQSFMIFVGQKALTRQAGTTGQRADEDLYSLSDLCSIAGIEEVYSDLSGHTHHLSDDGKHRLLKVLHGDASTPEKIDQRVREHIKKNWQDLMPSVVILRQSLEGGVRQGATIKIAENEMGQDLNWSIRMESGHILKGAQRIDTLPLKESKRVDNQLIHELVLDPPRQLPLGYHELELQIGERHATVKFIIAPSHCYRPPFMENHERLFGIAHQLYSLGRGTDKGIGDFSDLGDLAFAAGKIGADVLGVSPLHAMFSEIPERASPYSPSSRLALNSFYLDVSKIDGFDDCAEAEPYASANDALVDYPLVASTKGQVFNELFTHFLRNATIEQKHHFAEFCFERGKSLRLFSCFSALCEHFEGQQPGDWPKAYQDANSDEVEAFAKQNEVRIFFHSWLQWQAELQLRRAADICAEQGMKVGLYGDLAVGVAADGAECWASPSNYLHDISFGAPPDAFNADGQNWCMPPFDPTALRETAYQPLIDILRENMRYCGALRMDHVMWLQRMFVIPLDEPASSGAYVRYPFDDLLAILALESTRAKCIIIGEDLGTVPLGFRERMQREYILSYRLMRFEKEYDGGFKAPHDYPYLALSTPSSHDLPTIRGFIRGEDLRLLQKIGLIEGDEGLKAALNGRDHEIQHLINALKGQGLISPEQFDALDNDQMLDELVAAISLYLARAGSALTMLNLEDLAGSLEQVNVPGTVSEVPNWRHRLSFDPSRLLEDPHMQRLFELIADERSNQPVAHKRHA
jgi:glycogen debranching enzyme GlgX/4-alpha-glucanotransferase